MSLDGLLPAECRRHNGYTAHVKRLIVPSAVLLFAALGAIIVPRTELHAGDASITVPNGFEIETIAHIDGPRELAVARTGDLFVGTRGDSDAHP